MIWSETWRARLQDGFERLRSGTRRQALETLAVNLLLGAAGMGAGVLGARLLGPDGKGELAALQVVASLIVAVGTLGLFDAVIYYAAREPDEGPRDSVAATTSLLFLGAVFLPVALFVVPWILPDARSGVVWGARVYLGVFPAFVLLGTVQSLLRARLELRAWNAVRAASQVLWLLVLFGGWALAVRVPETLAAAYVGALLVLALLVLFLFRRLWWSGWPPRLGRFPRLLRYGLPVALRTGPRQLNLRLDVLVLAVFLSPAEVGFYAAAASWSMMLMPLPQALASVLFPRLSREKDETRRRHLETRALLLGLGAVVAGAGLLAVATPLGFPMLFGRDFESGMPYALGLLLAGAVLAFTQILGSLLQSRGRTAPLLWAEMTGLAVTVLGLFVLVPSLGAWGAVATSTVSYLITAGILLFFLWRARQGASGEV